jgi:HEAT repeat protein
LGDILELHLNAGHTDKDHTELRYFLCMALGEFETAETLPILIRAATKEDDPSEVNVRRGAVWAMGRIAEHQGADVLASNDDAMRALERAATDGEELQPGSDADGKERFLTRGRLRSTAVFVLGKVGDERAKQIIAGRLFSDPHPDTRYNAAAQLARLGDDRALPLLVEMMDPDNVKASQFESGDAEKTWKRQEVVVQGMEAVSAWLAARADVNAQYKTADGVTIEDLKMSVQKVIDADFGGLVETRARDLQRVLNER